MVSLPRSLLSQNYKYTNTMSNTPQIQSVFGEKITMIHNGFPTTATPLASFLAWSRPSCANICRLSLNPFADDIWWCQYTNMYIYQLTNFCQNIFGDIWRFQYTWCFPPESSHTRIEASHGNSLYIWNLMKIYAESECSPTGAISIESESTL